MPSPSRHLLAVASLPLLFSPSLAVPAVSAVHLAFVFVQDPLTVAPAVELKDSDAPRPRAGLVAV